MRRLRSVSDPSEMTDNSPLSLAGPVGTNQGTVDNDSEQGGDGVSMTVATSTNIQTHTSTLLGKRKDQQSGSSTDTPEAKKKMKL